jgi:hypothetical protein
VALGARLIAAQYGFDGVRGVDIVPEFCTRVQSNVEILSASRATASKVEIFLEDAISYSEKCDDDIVFLYNPFPLEVLRRVLSNLVEKVRLGQLSKTLIYTERAVEGSSNLQVLNEISSLRKLFVHCSWGQAFHVFRCMPPA